MRVYLVRHGETIHNRDKRIQGPLLDDPLNERGLLQAAAVEQRFARAAQREGLRLAATYSSPLRRAFMTAEHVARGASTLAPTPLAGLAEYSWGIHLGKTETGDTLQAMRDLHARWKSGDVHAAPPEGESPETAFARAWSDLEPILAKHTGDTIAIVGHGRLFKIILSKLVARSASRMEEFPQGNTAVTLLEHDDAAPLRESWRVVFLNDQSHLADVPGAKPPPHDSGPALV